MKDQHLEKSAQLSEFPKPTLAVFAADYWEHVCPQIRIARPAKFAGFPLIRGSIWADSKLTLVPDQIKQADLVVITREFPIWSSEFHQVMEEARKSSKFVVYELDDLLLEIPEQHPDYGYYTASRSAILQAVVEADAVVGSTPAICEYLEQFNPSTHLWENYLDDSLWSFSTPNQSPDHTPIRIGYMGGHSHIHDLNLIIPALQRILTQFSHQVQITFYGIQPPSLLKNFSNVDWIPVAFGSYQDFAAYFQHQNCDIFLAPLESNLFNHCKSHLKFLEYGALGVPGVYSRVKPYERCVVQGQNGFLASDNDEWETYIARLIVDPELRLRIGKNAQDSVRQSWLLSDHSEIFADLYRKFSHKQSAVEKNSLAQQVARKMHSFQEALEKELLESRLVRNQVASLQKQLVEKDQALLETDRAAQKYFYLYQDLVTSRTWKLMERLIKLKLRLVPRGSLRERVLAGAYHSISALKNSGIKSFVSQARSEAIRIRKPDQTSSMQDPRKFSALYPGSVPPGARLSLPAIAVLLIQSENKVFPDTERFQKWLRRQTLPQAASLIRWDISASCACYLNDPSSEWIASSVPELLEGISEKYLVAASEDLLQSEESYLETNLLALETEGLAFTVNVPDKDEAFIQATRQGRLPGSPDFPLLRMIVQKNCLRPDFSIDLSRWQAGHPDQAENFREINRQNPSAVAGKIISHFTNLVDEMTHLPYETQAAQPLGLVERHLLVGDSGWDRASSFLMLNPVDQIMPAVSEPSDLPTVFVVMPFLAVGGAEKVALRVMENLSDRVRFVVLTYDSHDHALGTTTAHFRKITPYVYEIPEFLSNELNDSFTEYLIQRFNPAAIYIANGSPWIYDSLPVIKDRHPSIRIANQVYDTQMGWINRYDPALLTFIDAHIGCNSKISQAYLDKGAHPDTVFFIENGTDPVELDPHRYDRAQKDNLKIKLGLPLQTRVVSFASRLNPQKRPMDFVEMARRFSARSDISFLMVGDGPLAGTIDEQIHRIGAAGLIRKPFYQPITDILAVSDVLVLPSEFEGNPLIVIEAQTMGVPVVATDVGNIREILERTLGGVVVSQVGDIPALMAGVEKMLDSRPLPEEIRNSTLQHFNWKDCAEKHLMAFFGAPNA